MIAAGDVQSVFTASQFVVSGAMALLTVGAVYLGWPPLKAVILDQEKRFDLILRRRLLLDVTPRVATILTAIAMLGLALIFYAGSGSLLGACIGLALGAALPSVAMKMLAHQRLTKLEDQLVSGIQTLGSGVRAGLNLVQAMQLVARDGPVPLRQEFAHMLREYEFGISLDEAMDNAADRIGSGDFRLLFAALQTHRERGGDLGETLDRIAASIREIQRLENRIKALTAQGRATARWLGAMPLIVILILYFLVDSTSVRMLFADSIGKVMILAMLVLNVVGFLWVRKVVSVDV